MKIIVALTVAMLFIGGGAYIPRVVGLSGKKVQEKNAERPELTEASRLSASVLELYRERRYDEALPLAKKALQLREKVLEKDEQPVIDAVLNLAEVEYSRRMLNESKQLFERALHSLDRTVGFYHPRRAAVLQRIGRILEAWEKPGDAERLYRQSLEILDQKLGPHAPETAASVENLAEFYQFARKYEQAEPLYQRLIVTGSKTPERELVAHARRRYACLLHKTSRIAEANKMAEGFLDPSDEQAPGQVDNKGILNGKALYLALPRYPREARSERQSGSVRVRILVNEKGNVISACAIEGSAKFLGAAEAAAVVSKFSPTMKDGKPITFKGIIIYNFIAR